MSAEDLVLATLPRGDGNDELRLTLRTYSGARYLDLRLWWRGADGQTESWA